MSPFRPLRLRGRLIRLPCHEFGVVAVVDTELAAQFLTLEDRPATARQGRAVGTVPSLPGEFHRRFPSPVGRFAVHQPLDVPELEGATARLLELEERLDLFIEIIILPGGHRDDAPAARDRGFRLRCSHSSTPLRFHLRPAFSLLEWGIGLPTVVVIIPINPRSSPRIPRVRGGPAVPSPGRTPSSRSRRPLAAG